MDYALIHIATVHFPIALAIISTVLVIFALITKSPVRLKFALEIIVIGALLSWAPRLTGEDAEDVVEHQSGINDIDLKYYIHEHEEMAERAHIAFQIAGALALVGWFFCCKADKFNMPVAVLALLAAGTTAGLMGWTGHLGGQIRHTEVREAATAGVNPTAPALSGSELGDPGDDDH